MSELFKATLNSNDEPLSQDQLRDAVQTCDILVPTVTDRIDRAIIEAAGPQLKMIANFGVGVNHHLGPDGPTVFATVGNNRVTIYEALDNGDNKLVQCYADPDSDENFYTVAWSSDPDPGKPILGPTKKDLKIEFLRRFREKV